MTAEPTAACSSVDQPFAINDRVAHVKFGVGTVQEVDGTKISVLFDGYPESKKVVASFIERAASEAAGGAA